MPPAPTASPGPAIRPRPLRGLGRLLGPPPAASIPRGPVDWTLVLVTLVLVIFGLVMVFSASAMESTGRFYYLERQAFAAAVGLAGMLALARTPTWRIAQVGRVLYVACLIGLVLVFVPGVGHAANGAARWIAVGSFRLQPSEFAKLALLLVLAERVARLPGGMVNDRRELAILLGIAAPPMLLVLMEPDFGTTLILGGILALVLYLGGLSRRWIGTLGTVGLAGAVVMVSLYSYRLARIRSWLDPWKDPQDGGYQVIQSWVALHRGGWTGQGLGIAMSKMQFLPFAHTDFVAAVAGEELGFLGLAVLIGLFGFLVWRGVYVSTRARSMHGMLVAGSIALVLGIQTLFNLGVIMGLVPPKGLVLPFMSYGASALMAHLWSMGVLLSVSAEREEPGAEVAASPQAHAWGGVR